MQKFVRTFFISCTTISLFFFAFPAFAHASGFPQQKEEIQLSESIYEYIKNDQLKIQIAREGLLRAWSTTKALFSNNAATFGGKKLSDHWRVKFSLQKVSGAPVSAIAPSAENNMVTYDRGVMREQYVNREDGIEQRFVLLTPDLITQNGITLEGDLATQLDATRIPGEGIVFSSRGTNYFVYGEAIAFDANNKKIPVVQEFSDRTVRFTLAASDLSDAIFPVTIDPILTAASGTFDPTDQTSAKFGSSVSTAGDVNGDTYSDVIVGVPYFDNSGADQGRVYVFHGSASGISATPNININAWANSFHFGKSVSTAGDLNSDGYWDVVIGAPNDTVGVTTGVGNAYIYYGTSSGLQNIPSYYSVVSAPTPQTNAYFGYSVSYAGDVNGDGYSDVVIGASNATSSASGDGMAYIYYGGPAGGLLWTKAGPAQEGANFGYAVSTAGDLNKDGFSDVIIGAPFFDHEATDEGAVFLYTGSVSGLSTSPSATLEPTNQNGANFGFSVSTAGDVNYDAGESSDIIVGAPFYDNEATDEGAAYVFLGSSNQQGVRDTSGTRLEPTNTANAQFGYSVSTAGDVNGDGLSDVIVGSPGDLGSQIGRAYVYNGTNSVNGITSATPSAYLVSSASGQQEGAQFGYSVSTAGDVNGDGFSDVIVGAPTFDTSYTDVGRAFVFIGSVDDLQTSAGLTLSSASQEGSKFGFSIGSGGDFDSDGYDDIIVGAPTFDGTYTNQGRVYLFDPLTFNTGPFWNSSGISYSSEGSQLGYSVAFVGDVNGDGYDDAAYGVPYYNNKGDVVILYGNSSGLHGGDNSLNPPQISNAQFGFSVAGAGDVNGDGYADVIVGAPGIKSAYVYHGSSTGINFNYTWSKTATDADAAQFGFSVAGAGDFNGDGYDDIIIGDPFHSTVYPNGVIEPGTNGGRFFVYRGSSSGITGLPSSSSSYGGSGAKFGFSVAGGGDLNADGYDDFIVGSPGATVNSYASSGDVYIFYGNSQLSFNYNSRISNYFTPTAGAQIGYSVSAAGDVNGDGYDDILVGAPYYTGSVSEEGAAYLFYGKNEMAVSYERSLGNSVSTWGIHPTDEAGAHFGSSFASGDFNADGFSDILVGAPLVDVSGVSNTGRVYIYYANNGSFHTSPESIPTLLLKKFNTLTQQTTPLAKGNLLPSPSSSDRFYIDFHIPNPKGGGCNLTSQYEFASSGVAFSGGSAIRTEGTVVSYEGNANGCNLEYTPSSVPSSDGAYHGRIRFLYPSVRYPSTSQEKSSNQDTSGLYLGGQVSRWYYFFNDVFGKDLRVGSGSSGTALAVPTNLQQFTNEGPSDYTIPFPVGDYTLANKNGVASLKLSAVPPAENIQIQFEIKPVGTVFDGTNLGSNPNAAYFIPSKPVGSYHWRARSRNSSTGATSNWVSFGNNEESKADFVVDNLRISNVAISALGSSSATISWTTNFSADSRVYYKRQNKNELFLVFRQGDRKNHSVILSNLRPKTTYEYNVYSWAGSEYPSPDAISDLSTFITPAAPSPITLEILQLSVTSISANSATITWQTNLDSYPSLFYRKQNTPTFYLIMTGSLSDPTSFKKSHRVLLSDLTENTTYEYFVGSTQIVPGIYVPVRIISVFSDTLTFTTSAVERGGGSAGEIVLCGNSVLDVGEFCDDGNTVNGDGCSAMCQTEEVSGSSGVFDVPPIVDNRPLREIEEAISEEAITEAAGEAREEVREEVAEGVRKETKEKERISLETGEAFHPTAETAGETVTPSLATIVQFKPVEPESDVVRALTNGQYIVNNFVDDPTVDTNRNGVRDDWEKRYGVTVTTGDQDCDADGLSDVVEYRIGTDPCNEDTDGDGYTDAEEFLNYGMNPLVSDAEIPIGKLAVMNMQDSSMTADPTPILIGYGTKSGNVVRAYVTNVLDQTILFGSSVVEPSRKFFINPDVPLLDGRYKISLSEFENESRVAESPVFTIFVDTSLTITPPTPEYISDRIVTPDILRRKALVEVANKRPVLSGRTNVGDIIFANWKSLLLSSALLADTTLGTFETRPSVDLTDGEHEVFVYALREEDLARSPDVNMLFKVVEGEVVAVRKAPPLSASWLLAIAASLAFLMLLVLVVRRKRHTNEDVTTEGEPQQPTGISSPETPPETTEEEKKDQSEE